jgi:UDP-glucuronate 4-epimerase
MKILVTGAAGFIGFHLTTALLQNGHEVFGLDNINDYYDVNLKYARLRECGIDRNQVKWNQEVRSSLYSNYRFARVSLEEKAELLKIFKVYKFDKVINLAAQAGVRYSIQNPDAYVQSNIVGFLNILEACRHFNIGHLVYASSSSVYGLNELIPFSCTDSTNHPVSLYAATKKANELMAHSYSYLYKLPTTGLRFFTVYGPWGRPDMAYSIFTDSIIKGLPIQVFNNGNMMRDYTYIDDVVAGIINVVDNPAKSNPAWMGKRPDPSSSSAPYRIFNLGNNKPVPLMQFINELELQLNRKAIIEYKEMQAGDVVSTWADIDESVLQFGFNPLTNISEGLRLYSKWYKEFYPELQASAVLV